MTFLNSIKLFCSNWDKVLKLFLYYLFSLAITALLLLPVILAFKDVINENINSALVTSNYLTVFHSTFGGYLNGVFSLIFKIVSDAFMKNAGSLSNAQSQSNPLNTGFPVYSDATASPFNTLSTSPPSSSCSTSPL